MMISRSYFGWIVLGQAIVWSALGAAAAQSVDPNPSGARPEQSAQQRLPLSAASVDKQGSAHFTVIPKSIAWQGEEYKIQDGIDILMGVIRDTRTSSAERAAALDRLGTLNTQLRAEDCLGQLIELYDLDMTRDEKAGILLCLIKSEDPRGLPLFYRALDREKDPMLRLLAANGLAAWNVQRGVAELISLLDSKATTGQRKIGTEAQMLLFRLNEGKAWGIPKDEIMAEVARANPNATRQEALANLIAALQAWFGENKQRFPDWKPGDAVPEAKASDRPQR